MLSLLVFVAAAGGGSGTGGFYELFFIFTPQKLGDDSNQYSVSEETG